MSLCFPWKLYTPSCVRAQAEAFRVPGPPLSSESVSMLQHLGIYIFRDVSALTKMVRALRHHLMFYGQPGGPVAGAAEGAVANPAAEAERVYRLLAQFVLPATTLVPHNTPLCFELWDLLQVGGACAGCLGLLVKYIVRSRYGDTSVIRMKGVVARSVIKNVFIQSNCNYEEHVLRDKVLIGAQKFCHDIEFSVIITITSGTAVRCVLQGASVDHAT